MEIVEYVRITNQDPECYQPLDIHWLEELNSPKTFENYCDDFQIYVPKAREIYLATEKAGLRWVTVALMPNHELYLATDEGFECYAVCETFEDLKTKYDELVGLFNDGTYQFKDDN